MVGTCFAVILCVLAGYNTFATARKNRRDEVDRRNRPDQEQIRQILEKLDNHARKLAADNERLGNLERTVNDVLADTRDMHAAQEALCYGVQVLLEHALHNGNDNEMQSASRELNRYLRSRRFEHAE